MIDVQKADPKARRTGLLLVICGALVGVALMRLVDARQSDIEAWFRQDPARRLWLAMLVLTLVTAGPVLGMSGYLWSLGRRIARVERFPPPGMRMLRDTPVVTGRAARQRGRLMQGWAAAVCAAGVLLAFLLWRVYAVLAAGLRD